MKTGGDLVTVKVKSERDRVMIAWVRRMRPSPREVWERSAARRRALVAELRQQRMEAAHAKTDRQ